MANDPNLRLSDREVASMFAADTDAQRYPPILTLEEAADLLRIPVGTVRDWRSRGLLDGCCTRVGKRVRFLRNRLVQHVFSRGLRPDERR
ncbi:MAG: helix-turn-helix domain-containing protein [Planctomycetaceae bacterium]|nr:helix-turn-helix domain-containing protein [Planctomycetaceae bacterium]